MSNCTNSGIPTRKDNLLCDVCETMLMAVGRQFFIKAQQQFFEENRQRIQTKERLLRDSE
jgi:hypothetical protein